MPRSDGWKNFPESNAKRHNTVEYYKEIALQLKANKKYTQEFADVLYRRIKDYIEECSEKGNPLTFSGVQFACKIGREAWHKMVHGEMDWEYSSFLDIHNITADDVYYEDDMPYTDKSGEKVLLVPFSEMIEWVYLLIENELETRLYKTGRSGDIFALKAKRNWQEADKQPQTVNQTLVIASEEQAKKAWELLG